MSKPKAIAGAWIILACFLAVFAGRALWGPSGRLPMDKRLTARSKGDPKASVWVVEYFDYQCGACKAASAWLDEYIAQHPGRLYLQERFHPLQHHPFGLRSAVFAECAARQGKFWPLHDKLFESQDTWSQSKETEALLRQYAVEAGADADKLDACLADPSAEQDVVKERDEGLALGITSTPTSFVNGKMLVGVQRLKEDIAARFGDPEEKKP